jgi:N-acetylneuraminic acid mutarotase
MKRLAWWVVTLLAASCGGDHAQVPADGGAPPADAPACPDCQLNAVEPSLAGTGETITLEGTFVEPVSVTFPGGVSQAATLLGGHRATVTVPAAATEGPLTVTAGGSRVGAVAFRRADFAIGLASFESDLAQADASRQGASLSTPRQGATTSVIGSQLYVIGGAGNTGAPNTVEHAIIGADGSLGPFATVPDVALNSARSDHTAAVVGNHLVVLGGVNVPLANSVEWATIHPDGSLGSFELPPVIMTTQRSAHTSVVIGNHLYVLGGEGIHGDMDSVERAVIRSDGSLGFFAIVPDVTLATPRSGHASAVIGTHLYVFGGSHQGAALDSVEQATIQGDGSLGPFATVPGVALTTARRGHASAVLGNSLYVLGGLADRGSVASVERAPIAADGSLGVFAPVPGVTLPTAREDLASAVVGNYLYLFGGEVSSRPDVPLNSVERATIIADGSVQPFALVPSVVWTQARVAATSVAVGNQLYFIGGETISGTAPLAVDRLTIAADGSLGTFETIPEVRLPISRRDHTTAVIGPYIYLVGGIVGDLFGDPQDGIERATIHPDGSLSAFDTVPGVTLAIPRWDATSAVIGDFVYVFGGFTAHDGCCLTSIERATIHGDGSLSSFAVVPGVTLMTGRANHTSVVIGNSIYILGGAGSQSVERATINADGSLNTFATVPGVTLVSERQGHTNTVIGNSLYVTGGAGGGSFRTTVERATILADGSLSTFMTVPGITTVERIRHASVVIGNSLYLLGGHSGLVDFEVEGAAIGADGAL